MVLFSSKRILLIYNPLSGRALENPGLLQLVIGSLQTAHFNVEVVLIQGDIEPKSVIAKAIKRGIRFFVICGGDGTIETFARCLIGKRVTLGILPAGTQNNLALSLGIPLEISGAISLLGTGQHSKVDIGVSKCANQKGYFLEVCSIGLFSALYDSADQLQKGDLSGLGDLISTLTNFPSAKISLVLDRKKQVEMHGHVALVSNLPFFGLNYRIAADSPFDDGLLDALVFDEFSKWELVGNVLQNGAGEALDERIQRFQARELVIQSEPVMPVTVDGIQIGETPVSITIKPRALTIITGLHSTKHTRWGFLRNMRLFKLFGKAF